MVSPERHEHLKKGILLGYMKNILAITIVGTVFFGVIIPGVLLYALFARNPEPENAKKILGHRKNTPTISEENTQTPHGNEGVNQGQSSSTAQEPLFVDVVFSADFAKGGACAENNPTCDIYRGTVDLTSGSVSALVQLTDNTVNDATPVWTIDGESIIFTQKTEEFSKNSLWITNRNGENARLFIDHASHADIRADGLEIAYDSTLDRTIYTASLQNTLLGTPQKVLNGGSDGEPSLSPDGRYVLFQRLPTKSETDGRAQALVYDRTAKNLLEFSPEDGTGHCAMSDISSLAICDNKSQGGLIQRTVNNGALGERVVIADPRLEDIVAVDSAFSSCRGVSANYPSFCGSENRLLVAISCNSAAGSLFSHVFIRDLATEQYLPIGAQFAELFQGPGSASWSGECFFEDNK